MIATVTSKNPALVLATPSGGAVGTNPSGTDRNEAPMISVTAGYARPHLYDAAKPEQGIAVPTQVDVTALAAALNAQLNGAEVTTEVDVFNVLLAAAYRQGREDERAMQGVA